MIGRLGRDQAVDLALSPIRKKKGIGVWGPAFIQQYVLHMPTHLPDVLELILGLAHPLCALLHDPGLHLHSMPMPVHTAHDGGSTHTLLSELTSCRETHPKRCCQHGPVLLDKPEGRCDHDKGPIVS
jgi:hypothetical protein